MTILSKPAYLGAVSRLACIHPAVRFLVAIGLYACITWAAIYPLGFRLGPLGAGDLFIVSMLFGAWILASLVAMLDVRAGSTGSDRRRNCR